MLLVKTAVFQVLAQVLTQALTLGLTLDQTPDLTQVIIKAGVVRQELKKERKSWVLRFQS